VLRLWNCWDYSPGNVLNDIKAGDVTKDATLHLVIPDHRKAELQDAIVTHRAATTVLQHQPIPTTDGGKDAKTAMKARLDGAEERAKEILREAVSKAQLLVAGGAEVGAGLSRTDTVKEGALRVLDRLYPDFAAADVLGWDRVINKAKAGVPDAIKEVGHQGEPKDHPVCKAFLRALGASKRGSDLRSTFSAPPFGWPRDAVDAAMLVLANASQVKVTGTDHKPVVLASLQVNQFGNCVFVPEDVVPTGKERIAVRSIGTLVGHKINAGEEQNYLVTIVDRLEALAADAGGDAPAPAALSVPGLADFRAATGNALLVALAGQLDELRTGVPQWQAAKAEKERRLRDWMLAQRLIALGAGAQCANADAIRLGRTLLSEPNPLPPLVSSAADNLRACAFAAYGAWKTAWDAGEQRLKTDVAWGKLDPDKRRQLRAECGLLPQDPPDLSTSEKVAESLSVRGLSQWQDMAAALAGRIEAALQYAAIELEPKTQRVPIPRPTLKTMADLEAWLGALREAIAPRLDAGPVLPTA
jgi:hypothetical protein